MQLDSTVLYNALIEPVSNPAMEGKNSNIDANIATAPNDLDGIARKIA